MFGVILAIAFLAYMLASESIIGALIAAGDEELNVLLQKQGFDIFAGGGTDPMIMLLIGLSLFTCLVGIVNAMLMSVTERVREIGTLKCLGASDAFILQTFFIESSLQGIAGALIGMVLGVLTALGISFVSFGGYALDYFPYLAVLKALGITFLIGSLISITGSIVPAYMAARKEPVEAMRVEE
jgi:ABC-type lipoprotein release transport system permease subunit